MIRRMSVQLFCLVSIITVVGVAAVGVAQPRSGSTTQETSKEADRLDEQVTQLKGEGKLQEAIPLAERSLMLREKALGPYHPNVARSLNSLAVLYRTQRAYVKAQPLMIRVLDIREKALGPMHPDVAQGLNGASRFGVTT